MKPSEAFGEVTTAIAGRVCSACFDEPAIDGGFCSLLCRSRWEKENKPKKKRSLAPLMASGKDDWQTPDSLLKFVRAFAGGTIGLDPCTSAENPTGADTFFTEGGLEKRWSSDGLVWVNPPYSNAVEWIAKCSYEATLYGANVLALVPVRTDTRWWHQSALNASIICFVKGRLKFRGAKQCAPFPSALISFGGVGVRHFRAVFEPLGWVVRP